MATKYVFRKRIYIFLAALLDRIGYFVFRKTLRSAPPGGILGDKNILIVRMDHIGDVLLCSSAASIIKEKNPDSKVTFLVSSASAPLLKNNPFIDEVLVYDAPWFMRKSGGASVRKKNSFFKTAGLLNSRRFDAAFGLRGDLRENFMLWLAGIPRRIGYGITGGGFFLTHEAAYRRGAHESERWLDLLRFSGLQSDFVKPKIYFSEEETRLFSEKFSFLKNSSCVGLQIGAGSTAKDWGKDQIRQFALKFLERFQDHKIVMTGTDPVRVRRVGLKSERVIDLSGKTALREFAWLAGNLKAFIGPDSGPTHIAAVRGVPTVFLYSGTNHFDEWRPLYENAFVMRRPVPCSPCGLTVCRVKGHPCMAQITSDEVIEAVSGIL